MIKSGSKHVPWVRRSPALIDPMLTNAVELLHRATRVRKFIAQKQASENWAHFGCQKTPTPVTRSDGIVKNFIAYWKGTDNFTTALKLGQEQKFTFIIHTLKCITMRAFMNREYLHSAATDEGILFPWAEAKSFQVTKFIIVLYKGLKWCINASLSSTAKLTVYFRPCFICSITS